MFFFLVFFITKRWGGEHKFSDEENKFVWSCGSQAKQIFSLTRKNKYFSEFLHSKNSSAKWSTWEFIHWIWKDFGILNIFWILKLILLFKSNSFHSKLYMQSLSSFSQNCWPIFPIIHIPSFFFYFFSPGVSEAGLFYQGQHMQRMKR